VPEAPDANASPITPTAAELWQAFLEGAGLPSNFPQRPTPHLMRILGTVVHEMTEGLLQLIAVRAAAKNQLRAAMTVIRVRSNNPLKFSPDAGFALSQLLQPPASGFLDAPAAVQGAMHDMRSHLIGTMTGTRLALEGVLARFRPQLLEKQLASRGALDAVLPPIRRAKLWELYQEHFEALRGEAEDHFHQLFAEALVAACEKEIDRFERGGSRDPG
jgi:FHA domain-containing protein